MTSGEPSYIDFDVFLAPSFSPYSFANSLIRATNNSSDSTLDLSTPLSRVLFDLQEVDTHIHTLTTSAALPLVSHARNSQDAATKFVDQLAEQLKVLMASYTRLEKEVIGRWDEAEPVHTVVGNLVKTTRMLRGCVRCLLLGRQLEIQVSEAMGHPSGKGTTTGTTGGDPQALIRAARTIVELRRMYTNATGEAPGLETLDVLKSLLNGVVTPSDRQIKTKAQQTVKEFSAGGAASSETSATSTASTAAAVQVLHILSPNVATSSLLTSTVQTYLQSQLTTSLASLARSLTALSTLDRTLNDVVTRCANIVALEKILASESPADPVEGTQRDSTEEGGGAGKPTLLTPLLKALDTPNLPTHFFRTLASNLEPRVREIVNRGGLAAKNLRDSKERVRAGLRDCVLKGVASSGGAKGMEGLAAMMVGAVGVLR